MKTHIVRSIAILLFLVTPSLSAFASDLFHQLTEDNGLSSRTSFSIRQDKWGYIWISTKWGADRFDGRNIKQYPLEKSTKRGYDQIDVNHLRHSTDSVMWAFGESGLLFRYNEFNDKFEIVYTVRDFFDNYSIRLYDLWFETKELLLLATSRGIIELNLSDGKATQLKGTEELPVNQLICHQGTYYAATKKGLFTFTRKKNHQIKVINHLLPDKIVQSTYYDTENKRLLIGTLESGLYTYQSGASDKLAFLPITKPIRSIITCPGGKIAVGVDLEGVFILNRKTLEMEKHYMYNESDPSPICSNNIRGLFLDRESNLWIATYHRGVSYQDASKQKFSYFTHQNGNRQSIGDNVVNAILEDSQGDFWFGTNNGISCLQTSSGTWTHFFHKTTSQEKGDVILTLCEDSQGNIWAGGYAFGVAQINKATGSIVHHLAGSPTSILPNNYIYTLFNDGDCLWAGGIMDEITAFDIRTQRVRKYNVSKVSCFESMNDRHLLVGTYKGLLLLNKQTGKLTPTPITSTVTLIRKVADGKFWIGTKSYGLFYYDLPGKELHRFSTLNGLSSNYIYGVAPDQDNNLWISTESGLNKLSLSDLQVEVFDKQDGLLSNQFNASACYVSHNQQILLGTADGAMLFDPRQIRKSNGTNHTFETLIYQFDLFNEPVYPHTKDSPLTTSIYNTRELKLPHNKNFFAFHFTSTNFQTPDKTMYSYYLEGHDLGWSVPSAIDRVSYSKVFPGKYTFKVRAIINGKKQQERSIVLFIAKPWWNTYWAKSGYFLAFTLLAFYIYKRFKTRQEKKNTESKIDFFITTAHDLLTPLSLIQAPLQDLAGEIPDSERARELLQIAQSNSSKLAHFVEKLLDFQRISLNASRLILSRQQLDAFLQNRIDSFKLVASHKFIAVECLLDESTKQNVPLDKEKISRIMDNLLSNAIKYTPYGGKITIEAAVNERYWHLRITDTGIGIATRDQRMIFKHIFRAENAVNSEEIGSGIGLKLVSSLVALHKGKITFNSQLEEGTAFFLTFPLLYEGYENPATNLPDEPPATVISQANGNQKYRILIVEDEADMAHYLEISLQDLYLTETCSNGKVALEKIESFAPHLIISDVLMPEMNGFELCERIKSHVKTSHIPFLLLTGVTDAQSILKGVRLGANDYIRKPFDKEVLKNKISNLFTLQKLAQKRCLEELKTNNAIELSNKTDNDFMEKLLSLIECNINNPELNISLLCSELALSRTLLYNKITQLTGNSPTEFIRILRLKRAATLLLSGKHSVADAAFEVGIDNPKYFSRIFKEFYGVSPKEYLAKSVRE